MGLEKEADEQPFHAVSTAPHETPPPDQSAGEISGSGAFKHKKIARARADKPAGVTLRLCSTEPSNKPGPALGPDCEIGSPAKRPLKDRKANIAAEQFSELAHFRTWPSASLSTRGLLGASAQPICTTPGSVFNAESCRAEIEKLFPSTISTALLASRSSTTSFSSREPSRLKCFKRSPT